VTDASLCYDDLKPEDFPLMAHEEAVEWVRLGQAAARNIGVKGQVRVDLKRNRLVRLIDYAYDYPKSGGKIYKCDWHCKDVFTQETYRINMSDWGSAMNEMEVLAWASKV